MRARDCRPTACDVFLNPQSEIRNLQEVFGHKSNPEFVTTADKDYRDQQRDDIGAKPDKLPQSPSNCGLRIVGIRYLS
jgi:hypothetical protein